MSVERQIEEHGGAALGLQRRGYGSFIGSRHGIGLRVLFVGGERISRRSNRRTPQETTIEAILQPPLDLGLNLVGKSTHSHEARAEEPERLNALLFHGLSQQLVTLPRDLDLSITDHAVSLSRLGWHLDDLTDEGLDFAVRLARAIHAARPAVPVARAIQAHAGVWLAFAREHHLACATSPLVISGELADVRVSAWIERKAAVAGVIEEGVKPGDATFAPTFRAAFPRSLPFQLDALRSKPSLFETLAWLHVTDVTIGNRAFDKQFRVLTDQPDVAQRALLPIADALVRYARAGHVHVGFHGITFSPDLLGPPDAVEPVLEDLARLTTTLSDAADERRKARGVYR